jgi:hypothetical protein
MKTFVLTLLCLLTLVTGAFAEKAVQIPQTQTFKMYSTAAGGGTKYSTVVDVSNFRQKTLIVQGYAISGHAAAALSGTLLAQCGPTSSGPFNTVTGITGTAISTTTNTVLYWNDSCQFMRLSWAKTAGLVSAWVMLGN